MASPSLRKRRYAAKLLLRLARVDQVSVIDVHDAIIA
ncbi:unnamed protein product, partial [Rotaria sp. Silwood1]